MKDVLGYEGLYKVTDDGKVWSLHGKGRFLRTHLIGHGYETTMLYKSDGNPKKFLIHRLVAMSYIPNPKNLREVNHKNANRLDNRIENLEWVSSKENKQHAIKLGLYKNLGIKTPKGSKHPNSKLTEKDIRFIRKRYKIGEYNQVELSNTFKVSQHLISLIVRGKVWCHVD